MERPTGIEPVPEAWQASVLPLYYGRPVLSIYSMPAVYQQAGGKNLFPHAGSSNLDNSGRLHDRRPLLPGGEARGSYPIGVHTRKFLAVTVIHDYLPVTMLAPSILR
jgi:hypothetical protein